MRYGSDGDCSVQQYLLHQTEKILKRNVFLALTGAGAFLVASGRLASKALADGALTITNKTIDAPVVVETRLGATLDEAVLTAREPLKKGESLNLDVTNLVPFWRREAVPGSNDGAWTDWKRVDTRFGDQRVSF